MAINTLHAPLNPHNLPYDVEQESENDTDLDDTASLASTVRADGGITIQKHKLTCKEKVAIVAAISFIVIGVGSLITARVGASKCYTNEVYDASKCLSGFEQPLNVLTIMGWCFLGVTVTPMVIYFCKNAHKIKIDGGYGGPA